MVMQLGCGRYLVRVMARGGSDPLVLPVISGTWSRAIDQTTRASVTLDTACCEALADIEPRAHELHILRGDASTSDPHGIVWLGPIVSMTFDPRPDRGTVRIDAEDLSSWWRARFVHKDHDWTTATGSGPSRLIDQFRTISDDAMAPEPSPGIVIVDTTPTAATTGERKVLASEYRDAMGVESELARDALDWAAHATPANPRAILVGEPRIYAGAAPITTLLDVHFAEPPVVERLDVVTHTHVAGAGGGVSGDEIVGDATAAAPILARYGLVERRYDEPRIEDRGSAQTAAQYRLDLLERPAVRVQRASLAPSALIDIDALYAGARVALNISTCPGVAELCEMTRLDVTFSGEDESVALTLTSMNEAA